MDADRPRAARGRDAGGPMPISVFLGACRAGGSLARTTRAGRAGGKMRF